MDLLEAIEETHSESISVSNTMEHDQQRQEEQQPGDEVRQRIEVESMNSEEPTNYEGIIGGLKDQGVSLEDLASEILRMTAVSPDDHDDEGVPPMPDQRHKEEEKRAKLNARQRRSSAKQKRNSATTKSAKVSSPPSETQQIKGDEKVGTGGSVRKSGCLSFSLKGSTNRTQGNVSTSRGDPLSAKLSSDEQHLRNRGPNREDSSTYISLPPESAEFDDTMSDDMEQPISMPEPTTTLDKSTKSAGSLTPSPPRLVRNQTEVTTGFPGAYNVSPSLHNTVSTDLDLATEEGDDNSSPSLGSDVEDEAEEDVEAPVLLPPTSNDDYDEIYDPMAALEAVRVDDILTVKAEPLNERYKLIRRTSQVTCALLSIAVALTITLTARWKPASDSEETKTTPSPTYDADTRFQLIQELLIEEFAPLYDSNHNTSNGTLVLQETFLNNTTPQYQALHWLAREDPELEVLTQSHLEDSGDHDNNNGERTLASNFDVIVGSEETPWENHNNNPAAARNSTQTNSPSEAPLTSFVIIDTNETNTAVEQATNVASSSDDNGASWPNDGTTMSRDRIVQRYALAVLHFSTGNWTESFEFLSPGHECDWSGALQCSENNAITHLDLRNNALEGSIPFELGALSHLQSLNLASNALGGSLPQSLHALSDLQQLDLGFNQLTGTIHDDFYKNWKQLEFWSLAECDLTGTISSYIGNLENLKKLTWQRNELHGSLPSEFWAKLTNMEVLDLSQQRYKFVNDTIGTEIGMWSNLESLIYHGLELRGSIPSQLGKLTRLGRLQIASNHLSGTIPSELGGLTAVTRLSLSLNAITGTVPTEFVQLTALTRLYLQNTLLSGDVSFLCDAIDDGILQPMDPMRVDMGEVSGCRCCTCCLY